MIGVFCLAVLVLSVAKPGSGAAQPIIIDTDLFGDVDDSGALAVANVLHNCGLADLRGVVLNTQSQYGAPAASSICTYYGNGDVPVGALRPLTNETFFDNWQYIRGEYVSKVAYNWPGTLTNASLAPTPVELYRSILSNASNNSLHLISIGFLTNLADLLRSTGDDTSPLTGPQLIAEKVSEVVIMGGIYPSGWEYNFGGTDPNSTIYVLENWPKTVPMTFSGNELGGNIYTGHRVQANAPADSPILAAYQWYVTRDSVTREAWDPLTTLYGIIGLDGFAALGTKPLLQYANDYGHNSITASNGSNAWMNDTTVTNQHWLKLADGITNTTMAELLDNFLIYAPSQLVCPL